MIDLKYPYNTEDFQELVSKLNNYENFMSFYHGISDEAGAEYLKDQLFINFYKKYYS